MPRRLFTFPNRLLLALVLTLACACCPALLAQRVFWNDAGSGDPADLQLVYENCVPSAAPELPHVEGVTFAFRGQSTQTQIINFTKTSLHALNYRLQISEPGPVEIPTFTVVTNKGELSVPAYNSGALQPGPEADIKARLAPSKTSVWAGEVFRLSYSIDVARRSFANFGDVIDWAPAPLVAEDWSEPSAIETTRAGEQRLLITFRSRAYAKEPGPLRIPALHQLININLGSAGFGFFAQSRIEQVALATDRPELDVRPLPLPAPAHFVSAVGSFQLDSQIVPQTASVGEPITWTLKLSGTGNWPDIAGLPPRSVSSDFQAIQPPAKRTLEDGQLFSGELSEDVVLIPTRPGSYTLGPYELYTFDADSGEYLRHQIPATTIEVSPAVPHTHNHAVASNAPPADGAEGDAASASLGGDRRPAAPEHASLPKLAEAGAPPSGLIQTPLSGSAVPRAPTASMAKIAARAAAPLAAIPALWLGLALWRTRRLDPLRGRRAARAQLAATLAALRKDVGAPPALLLAWQQQAARALGIDHAVPAAAQIPEGAWRVLWSEAEQRLYRAQAPLPSDWLPRAEAAFTALKKPGTRWASAFSKAQLCPWLTMLALAFAMAPGAAAQNVASSPAAQTEEGGEHAQDFLTAYETGDFAEAEASARQAVATQPRDWIARHNLALALAQQEQWAAATAHSSAAFLQNPRSEATRWNLTIASSKAGYAPSELRAALSSGPRGTLASLASPSAWECWLVVGSATVALALLLPLLRGYGLLRISARSAKMAAASFATLGALLAALAIVGRASYGLATHPQAALVWRAGQLYSIPSEAETAQQTVPLQAGAVGVVEKHFLGWAQLRFANGQSGWLRHSELVPLWEAPVRALQAQERNAGQ